MDNGKVAEYDKPSVLIQNETSVFKSMIDHLGTAAQEGIYSKIRLH